MKIEQTWTSTGVVLGNLWGGGQGTYQARKMYSALSKEQLLERVKAALENGSLDGGMGFESLVGAYIIIKTTTQIVYKGEPYFNNRHEALYLGNLTEEQELFLLESL